MSQLFWGVSEQEQKYVKIEEEEEKGSIEAESEHQRKVVVHVPIPTDCKIDCLVRVKYKVKGSKSKFEVDHDLNRDEDSPCWRRAEFHVLKENKFSLTVLCKLDRDFHVENCKLANKKVVRAGSQEEDFFFLDLNVPEIKMDWLSLQTPTNKRKELKTLWKETIKEWFEYRGNRSNLFNKYLHDSLHKKASPEKILHSYSELYQQLNASGLANDGKTELFEMLLDTIQRTSCPKTMFASIVLFGAAISRDERNVPTCISSCRDNIFHCLSAFAQKLTEEKIYWQQRKSKAEVDIKYKWGLSALAGQDAYAWNPLLLFKTVGQEYESEEVDCEYLLEKIETVSKTILKFCPESQGCEIVQKLLMLAPTVDVLDKLCFDIMFMFPNGNEMNLKSYLTFYCPEPSDILIAACQKLMIPVITGFPKRLIRYGTQALISMIPVNAHEETFENWFFKGVKIFAPNLTFSEMRKILEEISCQEEFIHRRLIKKVAEQFLVSTPNVKRFDTLCFDVKFKLPYYTYNREMNLEDFLSSSDASDIITQACENFIERRLMKWHATERHATELHITEFPERLINYAKQALFNNFSNREFIRSRNWFVETIQIISSKLRPDEMMYVLRAMSSPTIVSVSPTLFVQALPILAVYTETLISLGDRVNESLSTWFSERLKKPQILDSGHSSGNLFSVISLICALADADKFLKPSSSSSSSYNDHLLGKAAEYFREQSASFIAASFAQIEGHFNDAKYTEEFINEIRDLILKILCEMLVKEPQKHSTVIIYLGYIGRKIDNPLSSLFMIKVITHVFEAWDREFGPEDDEDAVSAMCKYLSKDEVGHSRSTVVCSLLKSNSQPEFKEFLSSLHIASAFREVARSLRSGDITAADCQRLYEKLDALEREKRRDHLDYLEACFCAFENSSPNSNLESVFRHWCESLAGISNKLENALNFVEMRLKSTEEEAAKVREDLVSLQEKFSKELVKNLKEENEISFWGQSFPSDFHLICSKDCKFLKSKLYNLMWEYVWANHLIPQDDNVETKDPELRDVQTNPPTPNTLNSTSGDIQQPSFEFEFVWKTLYGRVQARKDALLAGLRTGITIQEINQYIGEAEGLKEELDLLYDDADLHDCAIWYEKLSKVMKMTESMDFFLNAMCEINETFARFDSNEFETNLEGLKILVNSQATRVQDYTEAAKKFYENDLKGLNEAKNLILILGGQGGSVLLKLLVQVGNDDLRSLQDAVEPDDFLNEHTIRDLVTLKKSKIANMLKDFACCGTREILVCLQKQLQELSSGEILKAAESCVHHAKGLRHLYVGIADREANTKRKVESIVCHGVMNISAIANKVQVICIVQESETEKQHAGLTLSSKNYSLAELLDLSSRALLYVHSENANIKGHLKESMERFVKFVNHASTIEDTLLELFQWGYLNFHCDKDSGKSPFQRNIHLNEGFALRDLEELSDRLHNECKLWKESLMNACTDYYMLTFFCSTQFWSLESALRSTTLERNRDVLKEILRFAMPRISSEQISECVEKAKSSKTEISKYDELEPDEALHWLGKKLHSICPTLNDKPYDRVLQDDTTVQLGDICAAVYDGDVTKELLSIFQNLRIPERFQIMFCNSEKTHAAELRSFVQRAMGGNGAEIFVIVGIDQLDLKSQHDLVNLMSKFASGEDPKYRLVLLYEQPVSFLQNVSNYLIREVKFTPATPTRERELVGQRLHRQGREVVVVTSKYAGLGKTEWILNHAHGKNLIVVTFPIFRKIRRSDIIGRLEGAQLDRNTCLHIELSDFDSKDMREIDTLIFEACILGVISGDPLDPACHCINLDVPLIAIEVANSSVAKESVTMHSHICKNLPTIKHFPHKEIMWANGSRFLLPTCAADKGQVVSNYLSLMEKDTVNTTVLRFGNACEHSLASDAECLSQEDYQKLFMKHLWERQGRRPSFTLTDIFIRVLMGQLRPFTLSPYYLPGNIKGIPNDFRENVLNGLVSTAVTFLNQSADTARSSQAAAIRSMSIDDDSACIPDMSEIISWEQSKIVLLLLDKNGAMVLLYRREGDVPDAVRKAYLQQMNIINPNFGNNLPDLSQASHNDLKAKLELVLGYTPMKATKSNYVMTCDNLLKMCLIWLRIKEGIPVCIMGETGCGKTSLLNYLAHHVPNVKLETVNVHAGLTVSDILKKVREAEEIIAGSGGKIIVWLFFDEINTSEHIALLEEIVCRRRIMGQQLSSNIVPMAACNPYRKRSNLSLAEAGFQNPESCDHDPMSRRVYRVHPLPQRLLQMTWRFGSLTEKDLESYATKMFCHCKLPQPKKRIAVRLICKSHKFIIKQADCSAVSLRDVERVRKLINFFVCDLSERIRNPPPLKTRHDARRNFLRLETNKRREEQKYSIAIVLALAHCYHARLPTSELRKSYRQVISREWRRFGKPYTDFVTSDGTWMNQAIKTEQEDYVIRMTRDSGIALNCALLENAFVLLVCILNKMSVFLVGKPGSSKSLAIELINNSLRGSDSRDPYFRTLPEIQRHSYQGSEDSRAEGIERVFMKVDRLAKKEQQQQSDGGASLQRVLHVILIDEMGLAERSPHNPLKVIHAWLDRGLPIIGISNWCLDASKMNRGIYLARPDPDEDDLYETAEKIYRGRRQSVHTRPKLTNLLKSISKVYFRRTQHKDSRKKNFHGLRDFYSLVKSIRHFRDGIGIDNKSLMRAIARNFSGFPDRHYVEERRRSSERDFCAQVLKREVTYDDLQNDCPVIELIKKNIEDEEARHLMLITQSNSAIPILNMYLDVSNIEVMYGSMFPDDSGDEYNYRMLSKIILCMEGGRKLFLKGLDKIYGALYDMLNQHYTWFGGKKNCRVALGADSNPLCQVHPEFRCILLQDEEDLDDVDAPLKQRCEKQILNITDVLTPQQCCLVENCKHWSKHVCTMQRRGHVWNRDLTFNMYSRSTFENHVLPSLVIQCETEFQIKSKLFRIMTMDGVVRSTRLLGCGGESNELDTLLDDYFKDPSHANICEAWRHRRNASTAVFTFSSVAGLYVKDIMKQDSSAVIQEEFLGEISSERMINEKIKEFWSEKSQRTNILVVHCDIYKDWCHLELVKALMKKYEISSKSKSAVDKSQMLVLHCCRAISKKSLENYQINRGAPSFLEGWDQVMVDQIDGSRAEFDRVRKLVSAKSMHETIINEIKEVLPGLILPALRGIRLPIYCLEYKKNLEKIIINYPPLMLYLQRQIEMKFKDEHYGKNPLFKLACNIRELVERGSISSCMTNYVRTFTLESLTELLYHLQKESALGVLLNILNMKKRSLSLSRSEEQLWCSLFLKNKVEMKVVGGQYDLSSPGDYYKCLQCPLSHLFMQQFQRLKKPVDVGRGINNQGWTRWCEFRKGILAPKLAQIFSDAVKPAETKTCEEKLDYKPRPCSYDDGALFDCNKLFIQYASRYFIDIRSALFERLLLANESLDTNSEDFLKELVLTALPDTMTNSMKHPLDVHYYTEHIESLLHYILQFLLRETKRMEKANQNLSQTDALGSLKCDLLSAAKRKEIFSEEGFDCLISDSIGILCGYWLESGHLCFERKAEQQEWIENANLTLHQAEEFDCQNGNSDEWPMQFSNLALCADILAIIPYRFLNQKTMSALSSIFNPKVKSTIVADILLWIDNLGNAKEDPDGSLGRVKAALHFALLEYMDNNPDDKGEILEHSFSLDISYSFSLYLQVATNLLEINKTEKDKERFSTVFEAIIAKDGNSDILMEIKSKAEYNALVKRFSVHDGVHESKKEQSLEDLRSSKIFAALSQALCFATFIKEEHDSKNGRKSSCIDLTDEIMINCFKKSVELLRSAKESTSGEPKLVIRRLFATAYIKIFIAQLVAHRDDPNHCGEAASVVSKVIGERACSIPGIENSIAVYALRELRHRHRVEMSKLLHEIHHILPFLQNFPWPCEDSTQALGIDPFIGALVGCSEFKEVADQNRDRKSLGIYFPTDAISDNSDALQEIRHGNDVRVPNIECFARVVISKSFLQNIDSADALKNIVKHLHERGFEILASVVSHGAQLSCQNDSSYNHKLLLSLIAQCALVLPGKKCPLAVAITHLDRIHTSFMVASRSDPRSEIFENQLEMKLSSDDNIDALYRCRNVMKDGSQCGFIYAVGHCGKTDESDTCKNCGINIGNKKGAEMHTIAKHQERLTPERVEQIRHQYENVKGFAEHDRRFLDLHTYKCRTLTPVAFRILHLMSNICLMLSNMNNREVIASRWEILQNDLEQLKKLTSHLSPEALCASLHSCILAISEEVLPGTSDLGVLTSAAARGEWETAFTKKVASIIEGTNSNRLVEMSQPRGHIVNALETTINVQRDNWKGRNLMNECFQVMPKPSLSELELRMQNTATFQKWKFLKCVMGNRKSLYIVKCLHPLLEWPLFLRKNYKWKFTRAEFEELNVDNLVNQHTDAYLKEKAKELYKKFAKAWNEVYDFLEGSPLRLNCDEITISKLQPNPKLAYLGSQQSNASNALNPQKEQFLAIIMKLCSIQNKFLTLSDSVMKRESNMRRPRVTLKELVGRPLQIIDTNPRALVTLLLEQLQLSENGIFECNFDHEAQENALRRLLDNKALISLESQEQVRAEFEVSEMPFKGEGFIMRKNLLSNVRKAVGHDFPLPNEDVLKTKLEQNIPKASYLMQSIETIFLCIVNEADGTFDGETELQLFCSHHIEDGESLGFCNSHGINLESIRLKHLICLFEILEDICSDEIIQEGSEAVPEYYRNERGFLTKDMKKEIDELCAALTKKNEPRLQSESMSIRALTYLEVTLRRFLRRYLTDEQNLKDNKSFDPDIKLKDEYGMVLFDLWTPVSGITEETFEKHFPRSLKLKHVFHAQQYLRLKLEDVRIFQMHAEGVNYNLEPIKRAMYRKNKRSGKRFRAKGRRRRME